MNRIHRETAALPWRESWEKMFCLEKDRIADVITASGLDANISAAIRCTQARGGDPGGETGAGGRGEGVGPVLCTGLPNIVFCQSYGAESLSNNKGGGTVRKGLDLLREKSKQEEVPKEVLATERKNIIFLDIDGVIQPYTYHSYCTSTAMKKSWL